MHVEDKGRFAIRNTIDSMRHLSVENMRVAEQVARGLMFAASPPAPANRRPW
ncbi:MAG: hypothetical protein FWC67_03620 [Defluviitaleaceae bacterium]|nr:hypothetical protein [Defluviitaleaceae bacterium]